MLVQGFISQDRKSVTVVGMCSLEGPTTVEICLDGVQRSAMAGPFHVFVSDSQKSFVESAPVLLDGNVLRFEVGNRSIFTLTNLPVK
jgi:hypothetical protein